MREASKKCIEMIKNFEGFRDRPYKCSENEQYYTIGYGHYGITNPNMKIDKSTGERFLLEDLEKTYEALEWYDDIYHFSDNEYDALVSFAFNIGGVNQLTQSGTRNKYEIANAMLKYVTDGVNVLEGLVKRREIEHNLFVNGVYPSDIVVNSNIDTPVAKIGLDDTIEHLVDDIILGKYGNGEDRKNAIYDAVQELVNYKLGAN